MRQKSPDRELTLKQRKFIRYYIESGNATQSALQAYRCKDEVTAASIGYENLRKLQILRPIRILMDKAGLCEGKLVKVLAEGLEATRILSYLNKVEVPDHSTRHRFLLTALELLGYIKNKEVIPNIDQSKHLTFQDINPANMTTEELVRDLSSRLTEMNRSQCRG